MRCDECRDGMRDFLDGEVDEVRRREIGRHLASCPECGRRVADDRFWDVTIRRHLERELPPGLRASILGDVPAGRAGRSRGETLGARASWQVAWWAVRRDLRDPWKLVPTIVAAAAVILFVGWLTDRAGPPRNDAGEAFRQPGPVLQLDQRPDWHPGDPVPTSRLALSGRLI